MKIIGKTTSGYLVEATGGELANCTGLNHAFSFPVDVYVDRFDKAKGLKIGTIIKPDVTHSFLHNLRDNEAKAKQGAGILRALADMMDGALPTTIIPPEEPAQQAAE